MDTPGDRMDTPGTGGAGDTPGDRMDAPGTGGAGDQPGIPFL